MAKKKIMLFIVEGATDKIALSTVLNRIFSSDTVAFHIVGGDVLTRDFVTSDKIIKAVGDEVKRFLGSIYKKSDLCNIVHLVDTDGAYIQDTDIVKADESDCAGSRFPVYQLDKILTPTPQTIQDRNHRKRTNLTKLCGKDDILGVPYYVYYFSCNLDHVLYGQNNLTEKEKSSLAEQFDLKYADDIPAFLHFMRDESFAVHGSYEETWKFIKTDRHSLERHSNLQLILPDASSANSGV